MKFEDKFPESIETAANFDPSMVNFLATQVSISLTFAALARDTREFDKRQRKLANAKEGYAVALYYLRQARKQRLQMSPHIMEGMKMLRSMLREMGRSL